MDNLFFTCDPDPQMDPFGCVDAGAKKTKNDMKARVLLKAIVHE
jgi:hypothetical protein